MPISSSKLCKTFDKWAETYDESVVTAKWGFERYHDGITWLCNQLSDNNPYFRVIDLGCGTGVIAQMLQRIAPSIEYVGVDISNKMLNIARGKNPEATFIQTDFRNFDKWKMHLHNKCRCAIVSSYSLHHITDEEKLDLINLIFNAAKINDLVFLIVDYAFRNKFERSLLLDNQVKSGNSLVKKEIEMEYYANLSVLKGSLSRTLEISFERNGIWDWRITIQRYNSGRVNDIRSLSPV